MAATLLNAGILLIAGLCGACGGKAALKPSGSGGSGGHTSGAAGQSGADGARLDAADAVAGMDGTISGSADGGGDVAIDAPASDVIVTPLPASASNGVPIPPPSLPKSSCSFLGVEDVPCASDGTCKTLTCDCGGHPLVFDAGCIFGRCLAAVSCSAACALGDYAPRQAGFCLLNPACKSDPDCSRAMSGPKCLVPPGSPIGECISGGANTSCLTNANCLSKTCVVDADGLGLCAARLPGTRCNTDEQCLAGLHCALTAGAFVGACSDGADKGLCATDDDCQPPLRCRPLHGTHLCTSRSKGAPCDSVADCDTGFCVSSDLGLTVAPQPPVSPICETGEVGARCMDGSQCKVPNCVNFRCVAGRDAGGG